MVEKEQTLSQKMRISVDQAIINSYKQRSSIGGRQMVSQGSGKSLSEVRKEVNIHQTPKPSLKLKITFENSPYYLSSEMKHYRNESLEPIESLQINTNHARAEHSLLKEVCKKNNWKEVTQHGKGHILWYGNSLSETDKTIVKKRQCWYNRYVGGSFLSYKRPFGQLLNLAQRIFPKEYSSFVPETYYYPEDRELLQQKLIKSIKPKTFIAKPSKGFGGHGIVLIQKPTDIPEHGHDMVIQEYITNPLLIDNKKFDMRLYVMLKGIEDIEIYLCSEGMARFCTEDYEQPNGENLKLLYSHLTNFTLNKDNENYINKPDFMDEDTGTKRLVSNVFKMMEKDMHVDIDELKDSIKDVVIKSFLIIMPHLRNQFSIAFGKGNNCNKNCFQLYGIDILLDDDLTPWVLEINSNPSFNMGIQKFEKNQANNYKLINEISEIDKYIKCMVITDAFKILTCGLDSVKEMGSFERVYSHKSNKNSYQKFEIFDDLRLVFEGLGGQRDFEQISNTQFMRLCQLSPEKFLIKTINKYDYDLIFQQAIKGQKGSKSLNLFKFLPVFYQIMDKVSRENKKGYWGFKELKEVADILKVELCIQ